MSHYDFTNNKRVFSFGIREWHKTVELAENYGWSPKGTVENRIMKSFAGKWDNWNGNYFAFDCQLVEEDDAINLAQALKKALSDIPNRRPKKISDKMTLLEFWSGKGFVSYLKRFIRFCEEGIFIIR